MMIVGITGPLCTGKSLLSDMLLERGFLRLSFADEVRDEANKQGISIERLKLQDLGNEMRRQFGKDYWAKKLKAKIDEKKNYVVEGFRNPGEVKSFQELKHFVLVGLTSPTELRLEWMLKRNKDNDPKNIEELKAIDARDRGIGELEYGQHSEECYSMADDYIINNGDLEELQMKVRELVEELGC